MERCDWLTTLENPFRAANREGSNAAPPLRSDENGKESKDIADSDFSIHFARRARAHRSRQQRRNTRSRRHCVMGEDSSVYPAAKLGEYTVTGDIAEGTFGKVKSAPSRSSRPVLCACVLISTLSGSAHHHRSEGRHEVYLKGSHPYDQDQDTRAAGSRLHADPAASAHHQAVCGHSPSDTPPSVTLLAM